MEVPSQDVTDKISGVVSETVCYTLAEIHVHGILAGLGILFKYWFRLSEDHIAVILTLGFAAFAIRHHRKVKKKKKASAMTKAPVVQWYTSNF